MEIAHKKAMEDASCCTECLHLIHDGQVHRCEVFGNAIIEDVQEKHCRDSVYG